MPEKIPASSPNTPLGDEALVSKPIQPGEAVDLCNRVAAALNLAPGEDRNAWEKLARTLAERFDTFEEVSIWRLRAEEAGELGTRTPRSESAATIEGNKMPVTTKDVHDTLIDAERYRWLRNQCNEQSRAEIVELAGDGGHMLDHFIDKGRCGL